jgi:hypothetical protein
MAQQEKKSKAELAAQSCGMTVVQLAVWGEVEGQEQLFTGA